MKEEKSECRKARSFENVKTVLFPKPLKGVLKQVRAYGLINTEKEAEPQCRMVSIALCINHPEFPDVDLILKPTAKGLTLIIPKASNLSDVQLVKAYKKPCGALQVHFEARPGRIIRNEHQRTRGALITENV